MIVCLTPPQINDFCDLLGTPYAPVSKIAPVKVSNSYLVFGTKKYWSVSLEHHFSEIKERREYSIFRIKLLAISLL